MEHDDLTVQGGRMTSQREGHETPSIDRPAEHDNVVAVNTTPSCSAQVPVAVEGSPQSEGRLSHRGEQTMQTPWGYFPVRYTNVGTPNVTPQIARPLPNQKSTSTQNDHTQPDFAGGVNDGASNSAMANTHRTVTPGWLMTSEQELRRKQLELDRSKIEVQQRLVELRERELELLKIGRVDTREPRTELEKASAWLLNKENGVSIDAAERPIGTFEKVQRSRYADNPTTATRNPATLYEATTPCDPDFREWQRALDELLSRDPRNRHKTTHGNGNNFGHSTLAQPFGHEYQHGTSAQTHAQFYGHSTSSPPRVQDRGYNTFAQPHGPVHQASAFTHPHTIAPGTHPYNPLTDGHAGTFGYSGYTFLSQSQIAARKASGRELPTFSGSAEQWPLFIASYEHSTAVCGYSDDENLMRLQKALKGAALEAVSSLLLLPSGLKDAIATLKLRFGRPDVIVDALIEKVRSMPAPRADRLETLADFGFAVRNMCATIRASGLPEYTCNVVLMKELVSKLPPTTCIEWARHQQRLPSVTLTEFGSWISDLAEALSRVVPVRSDGPSDTDRRRSGKPSRPEQRHPTTTHMNMHATAPSGKYAPPTPKCSACQGECASLVDCQRFLEMTVAARKEHVSECKLCRKCLKCHKGWCHLKTLCGLNGCEAMHHKLLHGALSTSNAPEKHCLTHSGSNDRTLFRYVPVMIRGKDGRVVHTFAFLDEGSSSTFMDHSLMEELGLSGMSRPLCLKWTGDTTKDEKASVQLAVQISGAYKGAPVHDLAKVHTVANLALPSQSIDMQQLEAAYPHLKRLQLTSYANAVPRLLIGVDNCRLGKSLKCIEGRMNEPIASKTRLGWIIYGPCPIATANVTGGHRNFHICRCEGNNDDLLTAEVKAYPSLDSLGITKLPRQLKSKHDEQALPIRSEETKLQGDRFETGQRWKYDDNRLPCNQTAALKRHVIPKLTKTPDLTPSRWFNEPSFLWDPESNWPMWKRLLRAVGYVVRFIANVRRAMRRHIFLGGPLTQKERAQAECILFSRIQADVYARELCCLKREPARSRPWKSRPRYKFSPVAHEVVRMRGRLSGSLNVSETLRQRGVIFTCRTSRAMHLEMAHLLITASCIMAIRRFVRGGKPWEMISNFVGSARELDEALQAVDVDALMAEFAGTDMKWSFNPPAAPHFGGCWERLVRSVKKVLGQFNLPRNPTDEVLMSAFTEIEVDINSRLLTYVPSKPPVVFTEGGAVVKSAWRAAQHFAGLFWKRWIAEYLSRLTRRSKWFENVRPIQLGDTVVAIDNCLPRNSWPKARVIAVFRAEDGKVR
ncbi:uncharacterized protein LOC125766085 [Anopheles funestus]|uniref:uncharacterized protein LOC125766085 n=1 Tax=Anopheles funestus TaxID=62324 RepID=UPI0020C6D00F|nr:uncharacterized protein LOC125766085 [Anopheles funestus]